MLQRLRSIALLASKHLQIMLDISHFRVAAFSDLCSVIKMQNKSGHSTTAKYSHTVHQTERWQELDFIHSDAGKFL